MSSWKWRKFKTVDNEVLNMHLNFPTSFPEASENLFSLSLLHGLSPLEQVFMNISLMKLDEKWNRKYLLEFIKRRSKAYKKITSYENTLTFDQWKTFFENYRPVEFWLVYKITENKCRLQIFTEFIQAQKK